MAFELLDFSKGITAYDEIRKDLIELLGIKIRLYV